MGLLEQDRGEHQDLPADGRRLTGVTMYHQLGNGHPGGETQAADGGGYYVGCVGDDFLVHGVPALLLVSDDVPVAHLVSWLRSVTDRVERGELPGPGDAPTEVLSSDLG
jgi:hypothetical protein